VCQPGQPCTDGILIWKWRKQVADKGWVQRKTVEIAAGKPWMVILGFCEAMGFQWMASRKVIPASIPET